MSKIQRSRRALAIFSVVVGAVGLTATAVSLVYPFSLTQEEDGLPPLVTITCVSLVVLAVDALILRAALPWLVRSVAQRRWLIAVVMLVLLALSAGAVLVLSIVAGIIGALIYCVPIGWDGCGP